MGYEINRFQGDVDEELLCPICSGVLEEPLQVSVTLTTILLHVKTLTNCSSLLENK